MCRHSPRVSLCKWVCSALSTRSSPSNRGEWSIPRTSCSIWCSVASLWWICPLSGDKYLDGEERKKNKIKKNKSRLDTFRGQVHACARVHDNVIYRPRAFERHVDTRPRIVRGPGIKYCSSANRGYIITIIMRASRRLRYSRQNGIVLLKNINRYDVSAIFYLSQICITDFYVSRWTWRVRQLVYVRAVRGTVYVHKKKDTPLVVHYRAIRQKKIHVTYVNR